MSERCYITHEKRQGVLEDIAENRAWQRHLSGDPVDPLLPAPASWMEMDLGALEHNIASIQQYVGEDVGIIAVTKADALGHGMVVCSQHAALSGATQIGVANADEASLLRRHHIDHPLLLLYPPSLHEADQAVSMNAELTVTDMKTAEALATIGKHRGSQVGVHIQIETGMHRYGLSPRDTIDFMRKLREMDHIKIQGICTHFATAGDDNAFAQEVQLQNFFDVLKELHVHGLEVPQIHIANSTAVTQIPDAITPSLYEQFMPGSKLRVRTGGALFGLYGDENQHLGLRHVLRRVVSEVAETQLVEEGHGVGYCRSYITPEDEYISTIPLGWGSGVFLHKAQVLIGENRCPSVGLIASNAFAVKSPHNFEKGTRVHLIDYDRDKPLTIEELAEQNNMISSQLTTLLGSHLQKVYYR